MIPVAEPWITDRETELVTDAVERGWLSPKGDYVDEFERVFADFVGTEYAFATSSGTSALHLTLAARGIGPGDEVIVPDLTWIACANVVEYVGATPVFADVTAETLTLDPGSVRELVTDRTAAIMPVHLYGHPCDMAPLLSIADDHDLLLLEDAAEAHGAHYRGDPVGSIGDAGCFSFYGNKILTTGQGGMVTTDDPELADRLELLRRDGMSRTRKYYHKEIGFNYRLGNLQAAVGVAQVERADEIITAKRRVAETYRERLSDLSLRFPDEPEWATPTYWMNAPVFESPDDRDAVVDVLEAVDVETRPFFYPLHDQPPYRDRDLGSPVTAMALYERGLNLPSSPTLTDEEVATVCGAVREALE
jgi:perosamine synthetase